MRLDPNQDRAVQAAFDGYVKPPEWRSIETAPTDRFILLYCHEDNSRWLAKWQGGVWYGVDVDHGLTREGHSWGDPNYVTGWFVSQWTDVPTGPQS